MRSGSSRRAITVLRNRAASPPSTTRWSKDRAKWRIFRISIFPSVTTGISLIFSTPGMATPGWLMIGGTINPSNVPPAYSVHLMSQSNLFIDFNTIFWPRVVLGVGIGFLFISLTTMTMSSIRKEGMGNATSIFNLLENLGGSFGVSIVTTMLARRAQFHQFRLVDHLTLFDRNLRLTIPKIPQILQGSGFLSPLPGQGPLGVIYNQLLREASMSSFNDAFYSLSIMMILRVPFALLMEKG